MDRYITDFQPAGESAIDVGLVCKDWDRRFSISTWINEREEKYTLAVTGRRKGAGLLKTRIPKGQAMEIVARLGLVHVKSGLMRSAGAYHARAFVISEVDRLSKVKQQKENELACVMEILRQYEMCL